MVHRSFNPLPRRGPPRPHHKALALALAGTLALLAGCNHDEDEPPTVAVSGLVVDGPLQGATVCYDLNDNGACDTGEPSATTDANGRYSLTVLESVSGKHAVLAMVPATAIDKDTGAAVGAAFMLRTLPTQTAGAQDVFVSPVTTLVADIAASSGQTPAQAAAQVQAALSLPALPLAPAIPAGGTAELLAAGQVLGSLIIQTAQLANANAVPAAQVAALVREATTSQLSVLTTALAASTAATPAARAAEAAAAVLTEMNLNAGSVGAVATALARPAGTPDAPGPFASVRRFAYTDANNYSYTLFVGDSSVTDAAGRFKSSEVRQTVSAGSEFPYNRNQIYWTGSEWKPCANHWEVSAAKLETTSTPQLGTYCGGSNSETRSVVEDITGKTLREVVASFRAYPFADSVGAHTDPVIGLPVNWGPSPDLLPASATFPAGSKMSRRTLRADIGGVDRIEITTKASVRWPDGVFRQATTLEHYSGMPGDLVDATATITTSNTVFVADLALASQSDATLGSFKRFRAGFDVAGSKIRFYKCDVRNSDGASVGCTTVGDGTLAISTQGGLRLMRVASGYPAELTARLREHRFWAESSGTVFRAIRDLERTRYDQRLNAVAWTALRTALGIPAHQAPVAPISSGPFSILRAFSFTDAANYNWRSFDGDSSVLDSAGRYSFNERRRTVSAGVEQPFVRNRSYWTGTEWYDCPSDGINIGSTAGAPPHRGVYCKGYIDERVGVTMLSIGGRLMSDVVNDIRAYGSTDNGLSYGGWGPRPSSFPVLSTTRFPEGATMEYRGFLTTATPLAIAMGTSNQLRVAPSPTTTAGFNTWAFATSLDEVIAKYPGNINGGLINGNVAQFFHSYAATPPSALYTGTTEIRVAFDAVGNKARFTQNNRLVSNGNSANYSTLLDTTYSIETVGGVRLLKFAAMPAGFEDNFRFTRMYAERNGGVWFAFKDNFSTNPVWTVRLNKTATDALFLTLGIP